MNPIDPRHGNPLRGATHQHPPYPRAVPTASRQGVVIIQTTPAATVAQSTFVAAPTAAVNPRLVSAHVVPTTQGGAVVSRNAGLPHRL
jgi:hypothetical protein